jgi:hypothetical protein
MNVNSRSSMTYFLVEDNSSYIVYNKTPPAFMISVIYYVHSRSQARKKEGCDRLTANVKFSHSIIIIIIYIVQKSR